MADWDVVGGSVCTEEGWEATDVGDSDSGAVVVCSVVPVVVGTGAGLWVLVATCSLVSGVVSVAVVVVVASAVEELVDELEVVVEVDAADVVGAVETDAEEEDEEAVAVSELPAVYSAGPGIS
jgi:hypothetical protein